MKISSDVLQAYNSLNIIQKGVVNIATFFYKFVTHDEGLAFTKLVRFFRPLQKGDDPIADKADQVRRNALPSTQSALFKSKCEATGIKLDGNLRGNILTALEKQAIDQSIGLIERLLRDDTFPDSEFVEFFLKIKEEEAIYELFASLPSDYSAEELKIYVREQILIIPSASFQSEPIDRSSSSESSKPLDSQDMELIRRIANDIKNKFQDREKNLDYLEAVNIALKSYLDNGQYNLAIAYINEFDFIPDIKAYEFNEGLRQLKQKTFFLIRREINDEVKQKFDKTELEIFNNLKNRNAADIIQSIKSISNTLLQRRCAQLFYNELKKQDELKSDLFFYECLRDPNLQFIKR